ncbi:hypothetical protein MRX96_034138 [Rhipicephalus microplus]
MASRCFCLRALLARVRTSVLVFFLPVLIFIAYEKQAVCQGFLHRWESSHRKYVQSEELVQQECALQKYEHLESRRLELAHLKFRIQEKGHRLEFVHQVDHRHRLVCGRRLGYKHRLGL